MVLIKREKSRGRNRYRLYSWVLLRKYDMIQCNRGHPYYGGKYSRGLLYSAPGRWVVFLGTAPFNLGVIQQTHTL